MSRSVNAGEKVVIGLGATGQSVVRFLLRKGVSLVAMDSRSEPPELAVLKCEFPQLCVETGAFSAETLLAASEIIISPGISLTEPAIARAAANGIPIIGDIELFARELKSLAPASKVVAITGSNGKSTVTTLLGMMAKEAGFKVAVGGNIGIPVLDLLTQPAVELFVLELSSFQLETTFSLAPAVATILNLSADHMDRYSDLAAYHRAKQRVYRNAKNLVVNRSDDLTRGPLSHKSHEWSFGLNCPDLGQFGLGQKKGEAWLMQGLKTLMPAAELAMVGQHNIANALAALALGSAVGLPMGAMLKVLQSFCGLPHRCERIIDFNGITFVNDSKATNVGATCAAINGLASDGDKIVLIAGGDGKGADFRPLADCTHGLRALVTIGVDGNRIAAVVNDKTEVHSASSMNEAVSRALRLAAPGDFVLLSPACASFDQYRNFEVRGEAFRRAVFELAGADRVAGGAL